MSTCHVSDEMIQAALDRLNEIKAADAKYEVVTLPWETILREVYVAMENKRQEQLADIHPMLHNTLGVA